MPNIVTYESKSGITPSDKGINAAEQAARHYGRVGDQIGRDVNHGIQKIADVVERHNAIMETSELYKTGTELELNLEKRYQQESALPENRNDPTFGDRFMSQVAPLLDQWGEGASTDHGKQLAATLKASIRNRVFNQVAAGQSEMDAAHVDDNLTQTGNMLGSGLITDPSEGNLTRTVGTMENAINGMTMAIPDVGTRERVASQMRDRFLPQLVATRYQGVAESIKNQIAETGGETSPALEQLNKDVAAQLGFQYLSPETQQRVTRLGEDAVRQGQSLFNSKQATAKSQAVEEGKARYAEIHNQLTNLALAGQGPTPELVAEIQNYSQRYGSTNAGEAASLDSFVLQGQDRAQSNKVQPYNQRTRDNIQAGFALPPGDPRRPTLPSLARDYSNGLITKEDLSSYTEILNKLDKPETDPSFKPAWDAFQRWQTAQTQGIGASNSPGSAAARAAFVHDVTATFMARGKATGWDEALKWITDASRPGSFGGAEIQSVYRKAANRNDAANWLKTNWVQVNEDGSITRPWTPGAGGNRPAAPTTPAPAPSPAADLKKADEIIWGKQ